MDVLRTEVAQLRSKKRRLADKVQRSRRSENYVREYTGSGGVARKNFATNMLMSAANNAAFDTRNNAALKSNRMDADDGRNSSIRMPSAKGGRQREDHTSVNAINRRDNSHAVSDDADVISDVERSQRHQTAHTGIRRYKPTASNVKVVPPKIASVVTLMDNDDDGEDDDDDKCNEVNTLKSTCNTAASSAVTITDTDSPSSSMMVDTKVKMEHDVDNVSCERRVNGRKHTSAYRRIASVVPLNDDGDDDNDDEEKNTVIQTNEDMRGVKRKSNANRNKRMFGALLGHLNKAKKRIITEGGLENVQKRHEVDQQVRIKVNGQSVELRQAKLRELKQVAAENEEIMRNVAEELHRKECKLRALKAIEIAREKASVLTTRTKPSLRWAPKLACKKTDFLLAKHSELIMSDAKARCAELGFTQFQELVEILDAPTKISSTRNSLRSSIGDDDNDDGAQHDDDDDSSSSRQRRRRTGVDDDGEMSDGDDAPIVKDVQYVDDTFEHAEEYTGELTSECNDAERKARDDRIVDADSSNEGRTSPARVAEDVRNGHHENNSYNDKDLKSSHRTHNDDDDDDDDE